MLQSISSTYAATLEKTLRFKELAILRSASMATSGLVAVLLAWRGGGAWSLASRDITFFSLYLLGTQRLCGRAFSFRFNPQTARLLIDRSAKLFVSRNVEVFSVRLPTVLVGCLLGQHAAGLFYQAFYLVGLPNALLSAITQNVAFPTYALLLGQWERLSRALNLTNIALLLLLVPGAEVLALQSEAVIRILYGDAWVPAAPLLRGFAVYLVITPLFSNAKSMLYGLNRTWDVAFAYVLQIAVSVAFCLIAAHLGSLMWVAWGLSIGAALAFSSLLRSIQCQIGRLQFAGWGRILAIALLGFALFWNVLHLGDMSRTFSTSTLVAESISLYILFGLALALAGPRDLLQDWLRLIQQSRGKSA